eukprot:gene20150-26883_t
MFHKSLEQERCTEALAELEAIHLVLTHAADELTEEPLHQSRGCFLHLHAHELEGTAVLEEGEEGAVYVTSDGRRINRMTEIPTNLSSPGVPQALHPKNLNPKTLGPELTDQPNRVLPRGAHEAAGEALRSHSNSRLRTAARDEEAGLHEDLTGVLTDLMEEVNRPRTSVPETRSAEQEPAGVVRSESSADLPPRNTALRRSLPGLNPSQSHSPIHTPLFTLANWVGSGDHEHYLRKLEEAIHHGQVAVQLFASEDYVVNKEGDMLDLWVSDPWALMPLTDHLENLPMGTRLLVQLVSAVEVLGGPEGVARLKVVLHVGEHQQTEVLSDLLDRSFYGMDPSNVIIITQPEWPGYSYVHATGTFHRYPTSQSHSLFPGLYSSCTTRYGPSVLNHRFRYDHETDPIWHATNGTATTTMRLGPFVLKHRYRYDHETGTLTRQANATLWDQACTPLAQLAMAPQYRYDHETGTFRRDPTSQSHSLGTGYSMMKLHWVGEGQTMSAEGTWTPLPGSALETLMSKGVKRMLSHRVCDLSLLTAEGPFDKDLLVWMLSHRARDLSLLTAEGAFDKDLLAYAMSLHTKEDINMAMHAIQTDSNVISRHHDSLILSPKTAPSASRETPARSQTAPSASRGTPATSQTVSSDSRETPARSQVKASCELRYSELVNPALTPKLSAAKAAQNGALITGMDRYVFHLPSLHALLVGFPLQPGLRLSGDTVHVSWDIANLFRLSGARAVPILSSRPVDVLMHAEDCEFLVPVLSKQDHDTCFRRTLSRFASKRRVSTMVQSADHNELEPVVVLVPNISHITDIAVTMAMMGVRPGKDLLQLVSVARDHSYVDGAKAVLKHYEEIALRCMARVTTEVLVQTPWNLIEVLDWHVNQLQAKLVVAGSNELTASAELRSHHVVNSVAFAILRRLSVPVLLVTANTKLPVCTLWALAEHYSQPMVKFLSRMLDQARGDRMTIAQMVPAHFISKQQRINYGLVLESFVDMVTKLRIPVHKSEQLPLPMRNSLLALLNTERSSIVGVQMPPGGRISNDLLSLLRSSHAGVLVYKRHA